MSAQLQFSEVLVKWRRFFNLLAAQQGKSEMMLLEQKLELEELKVRLAFSHPNTFSLVPPPHGAVLCFCRESDTRGIFTFSENGHLLRLLLSR